MNVRASVMIGSGIVAENSIACRSVGVCLQDALDVRQEAQVEHLVGLVEHQHRQSAELQVALLGQVEQPARRADDHVDALLQGFDLGLVGPAAVDGGDRQLAVADRAGTSRRWRGRRRPAGRARGSARRSARAGMPVSGRDSSVTMRCSRGTPKAKVLPMPVRAWPMRSLPVRANGSVSSWMAKVCSMPPSASARTISSRTPSSAKVVVRGAASGASTMTSMSGANGFWVVFGVVVISVMRLPT